MRVKDVMTKCVITLSEHASFDDILKIFRKNKISGAPVVNNEKKLVGIISEKDLLYKLFPSEKEFYKNVEYYFNESHRNDDFSRIRRLKASKIMTRDVIYANEDDHILTACAMLLIHNIRRLPVVKDGKIVGIVTTNNVFKNYLSHATSK